MHHPVRVEPTAGEIARHKIHTIFLQKSFLNKETALELKLTVELFLALKPKDVVILVNLGQVETIDSEGLTILLTIFKAAIAQKVDFVLCDLQPQVRLIMEISRMDRTFTIFSDYQALTSHLTMQAELESLKPVVNLS